MSKVVNRILDDFHLLLGASISHVFTPHFLNVFIPAD